MKRIYNARILAPDVSSFSEGEIWIDAEGKIALAGAPTSAPCAFEEEIDARHGLVLPGFKNAHTHSAMTFLRSRADDLPLWDWLSKTVFPREAKLCADDIYWLSKLAILEYLSGGITACFDMYFHLPAFCAACTESSFRAVLCGSTMAQDENGLQVLSDFYDTYHAGYDPLISAQLGFHAEYTADLPLLKGIAAIAHDKKAPVFMHHSETKSEVEGCLERHGMTPAELFCSLGIHDFGGGGFHCIWLSENDLALFGKYSLSAISCPASNLKLASGIAPLTAFVDRGIPFAIGTDGAASNNCLDFFREMYLCTALQKYRTADASALPADLVLRAAVSDGARAMGLTDCDALAPGKYADLVILDTHCPPMQPETNPLKNIVYAGNKQSVALTMVAGKVLYERGNYHIGEDPERIYRKAQEISDRIESSFA